MSGRWSISQLTSDLDPLPFRASPRKKNQARETLPTNRSRPRELSKGRMLSLRRLVAHIFIYCAGMKNHIRQQHKHPLERSQSMLPIYPHGFAKSTKNEKRLMTNYVALTNRTRVLCRKQTRSWRAILSPFYLWGINGFAVLDLACGDVGDWSRDGMLHTGDDVVRGRSASIRGR